MENLEDERIEIERHWVYYTSIHSKLLEFKQLFKWKWLLISDGTLVDSFKSLKDALEYAAYNRANRLFSIIEFSEEIADSKVATTHKVEQKQVSLLGFGPFKPVHDCVGYAEWEINKGFTMSESIPVSSVKYFGSSSTIIQEDRHAGTRWVQLRLCTADNKAYHGIYLGGVNNFRHLEYDLENKELQVIESPISTNPIFYVPALNRCVLGCECWWQPVDELKLEDGITDETLAFEKKMWREIFSIMQSKHEGRESVESRSGGHLWDKKHPFYGPQGGDFYQYKSWGDFLTEWQDADDDMNLLFRWDWDENMNGDKITPDINSRDYTLHLFFIKPRHSQIVENAVEVSKADEEQVRLYLNKKFDHLLLLWSGIAERR